MLGTYVVLGCLVYACPDIQMMGTHAQVLCVVLWVNLIYLLGEAC